MKNLWRGLLPCFLTIALFCCVMLLSACGCEHSWSEWETVTAATCTEDGKETRSCVECEEIEERTVKALGHKESDWLIDNCTHLHGWRYAA